MIESEHSGHVYTEASEYNEIFILYSQNYKY